MKLNKESSKHFYRLCESILRCYDLANKEQLRNVLQTELMVTLDRILDTNSLVSDENNMFPSEGVVVITGPLNSLVLLRTERTFKNSSPPSPVTTSGSSR